MIILNEHEVQKIYNMKDAFCDIKEMLNQKNIGNIINPPRTVIELPNKEGSVLYMPCTDLSKSIMSIKTVTIFPNNASEGRETTQGIILLSDANNGDHVALFNASYLTRLRTGAISGLATDKLALKHAQSLAVIGTGGMAFEQVLGVLEVRDIKEILLFNPTKEKAVQFKKDLREYGIKNSVKIEMVDDVSEAVSRSQIINCSTRSNKPVFNGNDVLLGTHVNGIGSYLPHMQEVDFSFIKKSNKIVVDDFKGVTEEAGELIYANKQSDWSFEKDLHGELIDLVTDNIVGRENEEEITFFKSVGASYYDLAVANGVYKKTKII